MISGKQLAWWIWLMAFRILCAGCILLGSLTAISCSAVFVLRLIRPASFVEVPAPLAALAAVLGTLFVLVGIKGFKIKSFRDVEAELKALGSTRDSVERWINK
jgi:hypothetical protein